MQTLTIKDEASLNLINHALDRERTVLSRAIEVTEKKLKQFEQKYDLSSADFYVKYNRGEMGDDMDIMRWVAEYQAYQELIYNLQ